MAVELKGVCKSYSKLFRKKPSPILQQVNLNIPTGAIYGLLGPSGCGKTTMLRCILGSLKVDKGTVTVLGHQPGTRGSGVPGNRVGYMPQELALYMELTIAETLQYFGRLLLMDSNRVEERMKFLLQLADIPEQTRLVRNLSGGQRRRVSFAAAILHEPQLLLLDEPTVGVDPLLRASIWEHLFTVARETQTTILITTHYIEEAANAHMVGLMRDGTVIAESSPTKLLQKYGKSTLEDVFLHLCSIDSDIKFNDREPSKDPETDVSQPLLSIVNDLYEGSYDQPLGMVPTSVFPNYKRMSALFIKTVTSLIRNPTFLSFQCVVPMLTVVLFALIMGGNPHNLVISTVNEDVGSYGRNYLNCLSNYTIKQEPHNSLDAALNSVRLGHSWGALFIASNFSDAIVQRYSDGIHATDEVLQASSIRAYMDTTELQITAVLRGNFLKAYNQFSESTLTVLGYNPATATFPIVFEEPVYGKAEPTVIEFVTPGIIICLIFFMAVCLTALVFVLERKDGIMDRCWATGLTTTEVIIGHMASQSVIVVVQVILVVFSLYAFDVPDKGPTILVITLAICQGMCGMAYGLLVSAVSSDETSAAFFTIGTLFPNIVLSGVLWPKLGMPKWLQYLSMILPQSLPTLSLRCIMSRGWNLEYTEVWLGYVITILWTFGFLILSVVIARKRR